MLLYFLSFSLLALLGSAATLEYYWNVTEFTNDPDGYSRKVLGINGIPGYSTIIEGYYGDTVIVYVANHLTDPTALHWHGMLQDGTTNMDGPVGVNQCEIPPGGSFTYTFVLNPIGTHWWHSHYKDQYLDGLRGLLIVHDPKDPNLSSYDYDYTVFLEDWYHNQATSIASSFQQAHTTILPTWSSGLINGRGQYSCTTAEIADTAIACTTVDSSVLKFTAEKRYRLRIINGSGFASFNFTIAKHAMSVIESDGTYLNASGLITNLFVNIGQRYSVIVLADQVPANYTISGNMNTNTDGTSSSTSKNQYSTTEDSLVTAIVQYDNTGAIGSGTVHTTAYYDESMVIPEVSSVPLQSTKNVTFAFEFEVNTTDHNVYSMITLNGASTAYSYASPTIPTLLDVYYNEKNASTLPPTSLATDINSGDIVDLYVLNSDRGEHPFHLHGHFFWVIGSGTAPSASKIPSSYNLSNPPRRDTASVPGCTTDTNRVCLNVGYLVLRFVADNPGVWFFHCHIDWHLMLGLAMTFVESASTLRSGTALAASGCPTSVTSTLTGYIAS